MIEIGLAALAIWWQYNIYQYVWYVCYMSTHVMIWKNAVFCKQKGVVAVFLFKDPMEIRKRRSQWIFPMVSAHSSCQIVVKQLPDKVFHKWKEGYLWTPKPMEIQEGFKPSIYGWNNPLKMKVLGFHGRYIDFPSNKFMEMVGNAATKMRTVVDGCQMSVGKKIGVLGTVLDF